MSFLLLRNGSSVAIDEIETVEAGNQVLEDLDLSIIAIEEQIERAEHNRDANHDWLIRTKTALKHKRRSRAPLQARIGELCRAKKGRDYEAQRIAEVGKRKTWLDAFVAATRESMPEEQFRGLCRRADEIAVVQDARS